MSCSRVQIRCRSRSGRAFDVHVVRGCLGARGSFCSSLYCVICAWSGLRSRQCVRSKRISVIYRDLGNFVCLIAIFHVLRCVLYSVMHMLFRNKLGTTGTGKQSPRPYGLHAAFFPSVLFSFFLCFHSFFVFSSGQAYIARPCLTGDVPDFSDLSASICQFSTNTLRGSIALMTLVSISAFTLMMALSINCYWSKQTHGWCYPVFNYLGYLGLLFIATFPSDQVRHQPSGGSKMREWNIFCCCSLPLDASGLVHNVATLLFLLSPSASDIAYYILEIKDGPSGFNIACLVFSIITIVLTLFLITCIMIFHNCPGQCRDCLAAWSMGFELLACFFALALNILVEVGILLWTFMESRSLEQNPRLLLLNSARKDFAFNVCCVTFRCVSIHSMNVVLFFFLVVLLCWLHYCIVSWYIWTITRTHYAQDQTEHITWQINSGFEVDRPNCYVVKGRGIPVTWTWK